MEAVSSELDDVAAAAKVFRKAEAATKRARAQLHALILKATAAGHMQVDIATASTYKREQVRRIVEADRRRRREPDHG